MASGFGRNHLIDWKVAIPFGITMVLFAPIGAMLNSIIPTKLLIIIFAVFTGFASILMLSGWKPKRDKFSENEKRVVGFAGGSFLGFLAGLIGRGGGSFVVPLLYILGLDAKIAAATSAFVVTCSGVSSFVSHIFIAAQPVWHVWLISIISVLIGSQLGSHIMANKMKSHNTRIVFGVVLLIVAVILILESFGA